MSQNSTAFHGADEEEEKKSQDGRNGAAFHEADEEEEKKSRDGREHRKKGIWRELFGDVTMVLAALAVGFLLNRFMIANAQVPTSSMETTVMAGDRILVNRLSYVFGSPARGDIVTFIFPDDGETLYLKRIMGLPGETIQGKDGVIYINGKALEKDFTEEVSYDDFGPYTVPEGSYFMMGDNRNDSWDSRYWEHKFVKQEDIIGKAAASYFPHPRLLK